MGDINTLADQVCSALEASLRKARALVENEKLKPSQTLAAINQIVRLSNLVLAKTLPNLNASHEIHTNTNEVAKVLASTLGAEEAKKRLQAIERSLLLAPKSPAGRPKEAILDG